MTRVLAQVSSEEAGKDRWTELVVHEGPTSLVGVSTPPGYILEILGCSRVPGETVRRRCTYFATRDELIAGGLRARGGGMSNLARQLLDLLP